MQQSECIFVVVRDPRVVVPGIRALGGGESIELVVARTSRGMESEVADHRSAIPLVSLGLKDGLNRVIRLAQSGAKVVICAAASTECEAKLKALAPGSLVVKAATPAEVAQALRVAFADGGE